MKRLAVLLVLSLLELASSGQGRPLQVQLRNGDTDRLVAVWALADSREPITEGSLAQRLDGAGAPRLLAFGETLLFDVGAGRAILLAFVPWKEPLSYRTSVPGLWVALESLTAGKQYSYTHQAGQFTASLQTWGLTIPRFALDGAFQDWATVVPLLRLGAGFSPAALTEAQFALTSDALWFHFRGQGLPPSASWVLSTSDRWWEFAAEGATARIWLFSPEHPQGLAVGTRLRRDNDLEGWIPLQRLPEADRRALTQATLQLRLLVETSPTADTSLMTEFSLSELP